METISNSRLNQLQSPQHYPQHGMEWAPDWLHAVPTHWQSTIFASDAHAGAAEQSEIVLQSYEHVHPPPVLDQLVHNPVEHSPP